MEYTHSYPYQSVGFRQMCGLVLGTFLFILLILANAATASAQTAELAVDINPGAAGGFPSDLVEYNGELYMFADDGTTGFELYAFDGTDVNLVADINPTGDTRPLDKVVLGNELFFTIEDLDGSNSRDIYKYDGSTITFIKDLVPGGGTNNPHLLTVFNNELYYFDIESTYGHELWKYDGATTSLVADIKPGTDGSGVNELFVFNGALYFTANDGTHGVELWKHDGATTSLVADIRPGSAGSNPTHFVIYNNALYFQANEGIHGEELWMYDGSTTTLAIDINPTTSSSPGHFAVYNGDLYMAAENSELTGRELFKYDGTTATLVEDIYVGDRNSGPVRLFVFNDELFFAAATAAFNRELWKYDGTSVSLVKDIFPGTAGSNLDDFTEFNGRVYFRASDGSVGSELWQLYFENQAPVLDPIGDQQVDEGELLEFTVTATDPDAGDTLVFSADEIPENASFDENTGVFSWTPEFDEAGEYEITFEVMDDGTPQLSDDETITITVDEATPPNDFTYLAILALNSVWLKSGAELLFGDIVVNDVTPGPFLNSGVQLTIGNGAQTHPETELAADSIKIKNNAFVDSDAIFYNSLINNGLLDAIEVTPWTPPFYTELPDFISGPAGGSDVTVAKLDTIVLAPGSYGTLKAKATSTVIFTGGEYRFTNLDIRKDANLLFDDATTVLVEDNIDTNPGVTVGPSASASIGAEDIFFYVDGINGTTTGALADTPKAVKFGNTNTIEANVYAPNGTVLIKRDSQATGAFIGRDVQIGRNTPVEGASGF